MEGIIIPIGFFTFIFGIAYIYLTTRHRERMALIEKGVEISLFRSEKKNLNNYTLVNLALLCLGVGLGILIGYIFAEKRGIEESVAYTSAIFIFSGLSLLFSIFIVKKMNQN